MVENDCDGFFGVHVPIVGANPSAICLLRRRLLGVVVEWFVERVWM